MLRNIVRRVVASLRRHVLLTLAALVVLAVFAILERSSVLPLAALAGVLGLGLLLFMLWKIPKRQASGVEDIKDRLTVENAARQTLAEIVGGAVLIAGLFFTWANLKITQETATKSQEIATRSLEIAREGQITDRFTKAIEQLGAVDQAGNKKLEVRLGGIYALERIAKESEEDHWPIMEVLTAYVRENTPWSQEPPKDTQPPKSKQLPRKDPPATTTAPLPKLATDIQAVMTVLGRRNIFYQLWEMQQLNLGKTDLRGADLRGAWLQEATLADAQLQGTNLFGAQLQRADLSGAQLQEATLVGAQLQGATLGRAQLQGVYLLDAQLQGAYLWFAQLQEADLTRAQLQRANLLDARLQGANLLLARLEGAENLRVEQLSTVKTLYEAYLDPLFLEQIQQQYPQLLEMPEDVKKWLQQRNPLLEMPEDVKKLQK
jgi:hypothetical protein